MRLLRQLLLTLVINYLIAAEFFHNSDFHWVLYSAHRPHGAARRCKIRKFPQIRVEEIGIDVLHSSSCSYTRPNARTKEGIRAEGSSAFESCRALVDVNKKSNKEEHPDRTQSGRTLVSSSAAGSLCIQLKLSSDLKCPPRRRLLLCGARWLASCRVMPRSCSEPARTPRRAFLTPTTTDGRSRSESPHIPDENSPTLYKPTSSPCLPFVRPLKTEPSAEEHHHGGRPLVFSLLVSTQRTDPLLEKPGEEVLLLRIE